MEMSAPANDLSEFFMKGRVCTITSSYLHHLPIFFFLSNTSSCSEENDQLRCIFTLLSTSEHWKALEWCFCKITPCPVIQPLPSAQTVSYETHKRAHFSISFISTGSTFLMCKCFFFDRCTFAATPSPTRPRWGQSDRLKVINKIYKQQTMQTIVVICICVDLNALPAWDGREKKKPKHLWPRPSPEEVWLNKKIL